MTVIEISPHALPLVYKLHSSTLKKFLEELIRVVSAVVNHLAPMPAFPLFCSSAKSIFATHFMTIMGVGPSVNCPQVILLPERSENIISSL